jgi:hypothetical protein
VHDVIQADAVANQNDFPVGMLSEEVWEVHALGAPEGNNEHCFYAIANLIRIKVQHRTGDARVPRAACPPAQETAAVQLGSRCCRVGCPSTGGQAASST